MTIFQKICCKFRHYYEKYFHLNKQPLVCERNPETVSDIIYNQLVQDQPCMITRFGSTELYCLANYLGVKKGIWKSIIPFLFGKAEPWWIMPQRIFDLKNYSGVFSVDNFEQVEKYCQLILADIPYIDVLGSWVSKEMYLKNILSHSKKVFLPNLEPYYASNPWTRALEGKKVLVVHPFVNQIKRQYEFN